MSTSRSAPTLNDVARKAGVSTATVSRCLNLPERVVPATREKVMAAVEALGYTPNFAARVMAAKRTFTIGAIIPTMENSIFARGLQAFQEELRTLGYTLLVSSSAYLPEVEHEQIRALVSRGADGLLLIGHDRDPEIYDYLERQKVPALAAWSYREDGPISCIGFDNRAAMQRLVDHVLGMGHRDIAMIAGIADGNDRARHRIEGLRERLAAHGLAPMAVEESVYGIESGAAAFERIMERPAHPTAILCGNDVLAVGALRGAQRMGLRVPEDVSITGFDDIEIANIVTPALTTVHVPHREMGRTAARSLVEMVETSGPVPSTRLETSIVERASLARRDPA